MTLSSFGGFDSNPFNGRMQTAADSVQFCRHHWRWEMRPERSRILVSAGSKHGSTAEIADRIAAVLTERGHDTDIAAPEDVTDLSGYDAVVLGSAVYAGHWVASAKQLADRIAELSPQPETWIFSSGPIGDPPKPEEDPVDVAPILEATSARDHHVFSGKIDKAKLSFGERAIVVAVRAPEGDFRDWNDIESWANEIADHLTREMSEL
jgi:menaquinone-dependent protoporphyrinogen oxidase